MRLAERTVPWSRRPGLVGAIIGLVASTVIVSSALASENIIVSGTALDESSGAPVGVQVSDTGSQSRTRSDMSGRFAFPAQAGQQALLFAYPGHLDGRGHIFLTSDAIDIASDLELGTVTLPSLRDVSVTVTDEDGIPLSGANFGSGGLGVEWSDRNAMLTEAIGISSAMWEVNTRTSQTGVAHLRIPILDDPYTLPAGRALVYTLSGARYSADLREAVETAPSAYNVSVDGYKASPPMAPGYVQATDDGTTTTVSWSKHQGVGAAATGFLVTASSGASVTAGPQQNAAVFPGLKGRKTPYTFTVTAQSQLGPSTPSEPSPQLVVSRPPNRAERPTAEVDGSSVIVR